MMSDSNRRPVSRCVLIITAIVGVWTGSCFATDRLLPAPGVENSPVWLRHGVEDGEWARTWPGNWAVSRDLETLALDSLTALLQSAQSVVNKKEADSGSSGFETWDRQLQSRWRERGYLGCRVAWDHHGETPMLIVEPGPLYRLDRLTLAETGDLVLDQQLIRLLPAAGTALTRERWSRLLDALLDAAGERGYPFARWRLLDLHVDPQNQVVDVAGEIALGEQMMIGRVHSNLEGAGSQSFLLEVAGLRPGALFRESDLKTAHRRLLHRGHWDRVDPAVVYATAEDTVGVQWVVQQRPHPNRLAAVLGLSRDAENQTRLSGQIQLLLGDIAGTGRRFELDWRDDGSDRSHLGVSWLEPLAFGTPLDTEFLLDQEVLKDVHTRLRSDVRVSLPVAGIWGVEFGLGGQSISHLLLFVPDGLNTLG